MIDQRLVEQFIRSKVLLQEKLSEIGKISGSSEIKSQMMFVEARMTVRIEQSMHHGIEEMNALRFILSEVAKPSANHSLHQM